MSLAYILLVHKNPGQVLRLVRQLDTGNARILVHVDRRTGDEVYRVIADGLPASAELLPRHRCFWGAFGHTAATLEGLEALEGSDFGHAVLLTGQDYPIKPLAGIEAFLAEHPTSSFLDFARLPSERWPGGGLDRIERWAWHSEILGRRLRLPNRYFPISVRRRVPAGLDPHAGLAYWCFDRECVEYLCEFVRSRPRDVAFFRRTTVPDELVFQTILLSSPLRQKFVNDALRYVNWSEGKASPKILTRDDLPALEASRALFARKFDPDVDAAVMDALDELIV